MPLVPLIPATAKPPLLAFAAPGSTYILTLSVVTRRYSFPIIPFVPLIPATANPPLLAFAPSSTYIRTLSLETVK